VRPILAYLLIACLLALPSRAQTPIERVSPAAAFAGGPIHLSSATKARLQAQYRGDNVPLIPQPFRGRLDTALMAQDWRQVEALKKALIQARDLTSVLLWDQTRFIETGGITLAAAFARDLAGSDVPNAEEMAATMWLYAVAASFTDGHKCADPAAREAYLDKLRGPDFAAVTGIIRDMPDDRLAAARDTAIRLESALSADRIADSICGINAGGPAFRPDAQWQADLAPTRAMLPRHLTAIGSVLRQKRKHSP
jgi:hypothetical protein